MDCHSNNEIRLAPELKIRTANTLLSLGFRTRAEVEMALDVGLFTMSDIARASIGVGASTLSDIRIWLGLESPQPAVGQLDHCPRCHGVSGYRTRVVFRYIRHFDWKGALLSEERIEELSQSGGICRDCEPQLRDACPHLVDRDTRAGWISAP